MMSPGFAMGIAGTFLGASAAEKRRDEFSESFGKWLPNISANTSGYFGDLSKYLPEATRLSRDIGKSEWENEMAYRERSVPGYGKGISEAGQALLPLLRGELPQGVLDAFSRSGGASSVGSGFGGSGFGFTNQGLFGARGALQGMQIGYGLLPSLLSAMPNPANTSVMNFLGNVMNPMQRTQTDLNVRQQNIGIAEHLSGLPTGKDMWGQWLTSTGGQIMGGDASTINTAVGAAAKGFGGGM